MSKLPKSREVIVVLEKLGFSFTRQKGSHAIYHHIDGRRITLPIHGGREISPGVFRKILDDLGIDRVKFWQTK